MKYTICDKSDTPLLSVDHFEDKWEFDSKHEKTIELVSRSSEKVVVSDGKHRREFLHNLKSDVYTVATVLGNMQIKIQRGSISSSAGQRSSQGLVKSSMPGKILRVLKKTGEQVIEGDALFVIEAMKMENEIRSPVAGFVQEIKVVEGQKVESGELIIKIGNGENE
ncbi:MAG: acetyl-CoA carboxylase biotin carboxyl carrier protein subunit [Bacteriovoracia bacterium]